MRVILIDDFPGLGKRNEVLDVAGGYARNYLIPKRLAVLATLANVKIMEQKRVVLAKKEARYLDEMKILSQALKQLHLLISRRAGETGVLFGSVGSKDIVALLGRDGIRLDRRKIVLAQPIKRIGNYTLEVRLHTEVEAQLLLSVLVETDGSIAQVKKKDAESDRVVEELDTKVREIEQRLAVEQAQESSAEPEADQVSDQPSAED